MTWDKIEFIDTTMYDIKHNDARDLINTLRWDKNIFSDITLYTKHNEYEIVDELISLFKFANIFVVFNYGSIDEHKVEL